MTFIAPESAGTPGNPSSYIDGAKGVRGWEQFSPEPFRAGQQVAALVEIIMSDGQPVLRVINADTQIDEFDPVDLTPEEESGLTERVGRIGVALITIRRHSGSTATDGRVYEIEPEITFSSFHRNPPSHVSEYLPAGTTVVVEGTFLGAAVTKGDDRLALMVQADAHRQLLLTDFFVSGDTTCYYGAGSLENMRDLEVQPGETIRVFTFVTPNRMLSCRSERPFCLTPSLERVSNYDRLRTQNKQLLVQLDDHVKRGKYELARQLFSELRQSSMTHRETKSTDELMYSLPVHEQPMRIDRYTTAQLNQAFDIDIESLNAAAYLKFAYRVGRGEMVSPRGERHSSPAMALRCIPSGVFTPLESHDLLMTTINATRQRLASLDQTATYDVYGDDLHLLEKAIDYLYYAETDGLVDSITTLLATIASEGRDTWGVSWRVLQVVGRLRRKMSPCVAHLTLDHTQAWYDSVIQLPEHGDELRELKVFSIIRSEHR